MTTCSDFPSEATLWIKEEEMVKSLDELKSSRSFAGKNFPNFEMLDARLASAMNEIIQNSHFKKKVSLEEQKAQKEDRFLRGRQIAFELLAPMIQYWFGVHPQWRLIRWERPLRGKGETVINGWSAAVPSRA